MTLTEGQGHKGQGQRSRKVTLPYFSETIEATVTKLGTKVLCDNALLTTDITVTLTEGQGHEGQGQRSRKVTLHYFSETIEATVIKLGTKVLCDNVLQNIYHCDLSQRSGSKITKSDFVIFLGNY